MIEGHFLLCLSETIVEYNVGEGYLIRKFGPLTRSKSDEVPPYSRVIRVGNGHFACRSGNTIRFWRLDDSVVQYLLSYFP